jgi:AAA15 family ATPase/GTPase
MLDSITIKNFKAIGSEGLTLNGLTNVNYLVGKNGCGKSSVLENIEFFNSGNFDNSFSNFTKKVNSRNFYSGFSTIIKQKINEPQIGIANHVTLNSLYTLNNEVKEEITSFIKQTVIELIMRYTNNLQIEFYLNETNRKGLRLKNSENTYAGTFYRDVWQKGVKPIFEEEKDIFLSKFFHKYAKLNIAEIKNSLINIWDHQVKNTLQQYIEDFDKDNKMTKTNFLYNAVISQEINMSNFFDLQFEKDVLDNENRVKLLDLLVKTGGFKHVGQKIIYADGNVLVFDDKENTSISIETLSSGQKIIIKFFYLTKANNTNTILIDEPETSLHPEVQKMFPKLFASFPIIQFFVATHSPFIISAAAKEDNQKVYLIDGGETIDIYGNKNSEESKLGYEDSRIIPVAAKELGAEGKDLGYPENFCILEESSLQTILDGCVEKEIIKKWTFISADGNGNLENYSESLKHLSNSLTSQSVLLFTNPFYKDKFCVIADELNEQELGTPLKKIFEDFEKFINKGEEKRFIKLKQSELEIYYKNINEALYDKFYAEHDKKKRHKTKGEFAIKIAELITTQDEFSKLFDNELDFLLLKK